MAGANFFHWEDICPELRILQENIGVMEVELSKMEGALASGGFVSWPEDLLGMNSRGKGATSDWSVFPLLHTFPASNVANSQWIEATTAHFPRTTALLRSVPNIRTALFSRLGPGTVLAKHVGWGDLANYVLRCHICVRVPSFQPPPASSSLFASPLASETGLTGCGLWVNHEVRYHQQGEVLVFDDSRKHFAFNTTDSERIVLIVDVLRPHNIPLGTAEGGHTPELDGFIARFR